MGVPLNTTSAASWAGAAVRAARGSACCSKRCAGAFAARWGEAQTEIELRLRAQERQT